MLSQLSHSFVTGHRVCLVWSRKKRHAAVFKYLFSQYIFSLFDELFWFYFLQCRKHLYRYHHFCAHKSGFIFKHFYKRNILSHGNRNTIVIGSNHKLIGRFFQSWQFRNNIFNSWGGCFSDGLEEAFWDCCCWCGLLR